MNLSLCLIKMTFSESAVTWSEAAAQLSVCLVAKLVECWSFLPPFLLTQFRAKLRHHEMNIDLSMRAPVCVSPHHLTAVC